MSITVTSNFTLNAAFALDDRAVMADNTARDAINSTRRYIGMTVFVVATLKFWQLQTGITNSDWVDITAVTTTAFTTVDSLTAFAGGGQASALALTKNINRITTVATAGDSVKLPAATAGAQIMVINGAALNSMNIYPVTGEAIDALGANNPYPLTPTSRNVTFVCVTAGTWISKAGGGGVKTATSGITAFAGGGQASATLLASDINRVTTVASANDSVKLPVSVAGAEVIVINDGVENLAIYGNGSDTISNLPSSTYFTLSARTKVARFICAVAGNWKAIAFRDPGLPTINYLEGGSFEDYVSGWATYVSVQGFTTSDVNTGTDVITKIGHGFTDGLRVQFTTAGGLPAPLTVLTDYYVRDVTSTTFKVSTTPGGTAVDITTVGSGVHGVRPSRPVALAGTSSAVTADTSFSTPLEDSQSFYLSVTGGNLGDGARKPFTISRASQGKILQLSFDVQLLSGTYNNGTLTTDSDLTVWIYDVTNGVFIQPSNNKINTVSSIIGEPFKAEFQTAYNSTSYQLVFHTSYGAATFILKMDNMCIARNLIPGRASSPTMYAYKTGGAVTANTAWTTFTATVKDSHGGFNATTGLYTVQVPGDYFVTGTAASGGTSNIKIKKNGTDYIYGPQSSNRTMVGGLLANLVVGDTISLCLDGSQTLVSDTISNTFSVALVNANTTGESARVVAMYSQNRTCTGTLNSSDNISVFGAVNADTHAAYNTSTGVYTVPVAGWYEVNAGIAIIATVSAGNANQVTLYQNGVAGKSTYFRAVAATTAQGYKTELTALVYANTGDTLDIRSNSTGSSLSYGGTASSISFKRLSGPVAPQAIDTIAASYWVSANFAASTTVPVNYDSKEYDTHGAVTTSATAWKFKAPSPGLYQFGGFWGNPAAGQNIIVYKNGVAYKNLGYDNNAQDSSFSGAIMLNTDDYIDFRPTISATMSGGLLAAAGVTNIYIHRIGNRG